MKNIFKSLMFLVVLAVFATGCSSKEVAPKVDTRPAVDFPVSREATIIENVSHNEVMIEATGIYRSIQSGSAMTRDIEDNGLRLATLDAKRAAIYHLLFNGTDPLLSFNDEGKVRSNINNYFSDDALRNFITFEESEVRRRTSIDNGSGLRIVKRFNINRERLIQTLERDGIVVARTELREVAGRPFIMVIPETPRGVSPVDALSDRATRHTASVIESYLTSKQYDVVVPEQQGMLQELSQLQASFGGDMAYQLALSIGSDIYITYSGDFEDAGFGTERYAMSVSAYETTTARLLGTETGYSRARQSERSISLEEAVNDAIDKVLSRVNSYWQSDMSRGVQYKIIAEISPDFFEEEVEELQFAFDDALNMVSNSHRSNIITDATMDYLIWVDSSKFSNNLGLYRAIKENFEKQMVDGEIARTNLNRKMLILRINRRY